MISRVIATGRRSTPHIELGTIVITRHFSVMTIPRQNSLHATLLQQRSRVSQSSPLTSTSSRLRSSGEISKPILIVEDEFLIAADLEDQLRQDGGIVAHLALSIEKALEELDGGTDFSGVILDINVGGITTFELADALKLAGLPFVFFTGYDSISVPDRFIGVPRIPKPASWREIKVALRIAEERINRTGFGSFRDCLEAALPTLRARARGLAANTEDADTLVEQTLEHAISVVGNRSLRLSIEEWLLDLLDKTNAEKRLLH
jgi:CheY-like chemotaxis protein